MQIQFNEKINLWLFSDKDPDGEDRKMAKGDKLKVKNIGNEDKNGIRLVQLNKDYAFYLGKQDNYEIIKD